MALAVTDLSNLFGMVKFYKEARGKGIKPIVGVDDGLDALAARFLVELDHAKQVRQVRDGQRHLLVLRRRLDDISNTHRTINDRVLRVHAQMDEGRTGLRRLL